MTLRLSSREWITAAAIALLAGFTHGPAGDGLRNAMIDDSMLAAVFFGLAWLVSGAILAIALLATLGAVISARRTP